MCSLTKFTTPIGKQTKDNYPNKLTDCQKQTKNPHFYLGGVDGRVEQNKTKTKAKQKLYCFHTLFRDRGCKPMKVNKVFRSTACCPSSFSCDMLTGTLFPMILTMGSVSLFSGWCQTSLSHLNPCSVYTNSLHIFLSP